MIVRPYRTSDREAALALHERHGQTLFWSDPDDPINFGTVVAEVDGKLVGILTGRCVAESFLTVDPDMAPVARWRMMRALFDSGLAVARANGFREVLSSVPPRMEKYADLLCKLPGFADDPRRHIVARACG